MDDLSPADEYEAGGDPEAARNWQKLLSHKRYWSEPHIHLVNFLRELYRVCIPPYSDPFVRGGSLVFNGAHIRIWKDNGEIYDKLWTASGLLRRNRISSHKSQRQQFEIELPHLGVVLVGCGAYQPGLSLPAPPVRFQPHFEGISRAPGSRPGWGVTLRQENALMGNTVIGSSNGVGEHHTWLQCERHSGAGGIISGVLHFFDFVEHLWTHKQVGPLGLSPYSEKTSEALRTSRVPDFD